MAVRTEEQALKLARDLAVQLGPRWEPYVWAGLVLSAYLYARGLRRMWREPGAGHGIKTWEAWCYAGGWFALFVALVSPLHPWGSVLLSAHMTQHEILMLVGAPLIVLGRPILVYLHALPRDWAAALGRASNHPAWRGPWQTFSAPLRSTKKTRPSRATESSIGSFKPFASTTLRKWLVAADSAKEFAACSSRMASDFMWWRFNATERGPTKAWRWRSGSP